MKKFLLGLLIIVMAAPVFAQNSNLIFFTEQGEKFSVVLNGVLQNAEPETNIKVTKLVAPSYKLKVIFDNADLGEIDKTVYLNEAGMETTFVIKMNKKGKYVVRFMNQIALAQAPPPPPSQSVIVFTTTPPPPAQTTVTTTVSSSQTTTTGSAQPGGENVSMNVGVNDPEMGVSFNMNVNASGTGTNTNVNYSETQSTTTTYSTTTTTTTSEPVQTQPQVYSMPGYNGPVGCNWPMDNNNFMNVKQSISSKDFEDSKIKIAKQVLNSNCLTCQQVKEIMLMFDFESTRLDFAKFAYGRTYDIGNYYMLNDAFDFESSIDELNAYINGYQW